MHLANYADQRNNLYEEVPDLYDLRLGLRGAAGRTVRLLRSGASAVLGEAGDEGLRLVDCRRCAISKMHEIKLVCRSCGTHPWVRITAADSALRTTC